jgi:hypothetical protein
LLVLDDNGIGWLYKDDDGGRLTGDDGSGYINNNNGVKISGW